MFLEFSPGFTFYFQVVTKHVQWPDHSSMELRLFNPNIGIARAKKCWTTSSKKHAGNDIERKSKNGVSVQKSLKASESSCMDGQVRKKCECCLSFKEEEERRGPPCERQMMLHTSVITRVRCLLF